MIGKWESSHRNVLITIPELRFRFFFRIRLDITMRPECILDPVKLSYTGAARLSCRVVSLCSQSLQSTPCGCSCQVLVGSLNRFMKAPKQDGFSA
jgi:hypothetical protein